MAQSFFLIQMAPRVSIIIVTWNSEKHIRKCLECISNQTYRDCEVIVIDNNSQDGSVEYIKRHYPHLTVIQNQKNLGFAKANNQGINIAKGEFILLLNPDVFPEPPFIEELVKLLSQKTYFGSAGGKLLLFKYGKKSRIIDSTGLFLEKSFRARDRGNLKKDRNQYDMDKRVFAVCGAAALFRKEALEQVKVGGEYFDEEFFAYYEDLDLGWRLQLAGYESGYTSKAVAYHVRGGSGIRAKFLQKKPYLQRLTLRNRYLMLIKNLSLANLLFFLPHFILTELIVIIYICTRAPHLLMVYLEIGKNLAKFWRKRSFIQLFRKRNSRYIRKWIK